MDQRRGPGWTFLTNHAQVLMCITNDPEIRLRDIGELVGITERASHRIVSDLAAAGYIARIRVGRRTLYTVNPHHPLPDPIAREESVGRLLQTVTGTSYAERRAGTRRTSGPDRRGA
jgi:hypothetical protein